MHARNKELRSSACAACGQQNCVSTRTGPGLEACLERRSSVRADNRSRALVLLLCAVTVSPPDEFISKSRRPSTLEKKQVLQLLRHPNIIHMEDVFESDAKIHMVMEIMQGGELFDYVVEKGTLSESEASVMVRKVSFAGKLPLLSTADGVVLRPSARASSS